MRTLITGIGQIVSGDIDAPLLDGDSIAIVDGRIEAVGRGLGDGDADTVIDAHGTTVDARADRFARAPDRRRLHARASGRSTSSSRRSTAASRR